MVLPDPDEVAMLGPEATTPRRADLATSDKTLFSADRYLK
jgi:hypothetical protein